MVEATIDVVDRGSFWADWNFFIEGEVLATKDDRNPDTKYGEFPVLNWVIDHPEATILWDTGSHHDAAERWGDLYDAFYQENAPRLDDSLEAAGYSVEEIDAVVQSHLHIDHAGGLEFFDGTDTPIYVHEQELKFAYYSATTPAGTGHPAYLTEDFDHDLNWQVVHRKRETHFEGIEFIHLPGHIPGLMGTVVHLDDPGPILMIGDHAYVDRNYENGERIGANLMWDSGAWMESQNFLRDLERTLGAAEVVYGHDAGQLAEMKSDWP